MRVERRNLPPSRALGALPPVPVVHGVQCTRTHADAVRGQPLCRVVQAGKLLPLRAEGYTSQPPVGKAVRHLSRRAHCSSLRTELVPKVVSCLQTVGNTISSTSVSRGVFYVPGHQHARYVVLIQW